MILIQLTEAEKLQTIKVIKMLKKKKMMSIACIAKNAGINSGRMRFIVEILVEEGRVAKVPVKLINDRYKRYKYEVIAK